MEEVVLTTDTEVMFKVNQILAVLESCFGRISVPMSVMLDRVTKEDIEFYYSEFKRLVIIRW